MQGEKANAVLTNGHHQLETLTTSPKLKYRGLLRTVYVISAEEGVRSLYGGLVAALQRQLIFASIRLGYYDNVKQLYIDNFYGRYQLLINRLMFTYNAYVCLLLVSSFYRVMHMHSADCAVERSVCLSHADIMAKRLDISLNSFHHRLATPF